MKPKLIRASRRKSCDTCAAQEGRHYCLLHSVQIKNMDTVRCKDWQPPVGTVYRITPKNKPSFPCWMLDESHGKWRRFTSVDGWAMRDHKKAKWLYWSPDAPTPPPQQPGQEGAHQHNPAHPIGTCANCGSEMVYNVPRLGASGGFVHKDTGKVGCPAPSPTAQDPYLTGNPATDILVLALEEIAGEQMAPGNKCDAVAIAALEKFRKAKGATAGMSGGEPTPKVYEACLNWDGTGDYRMKVVSLEDHQQALQRAEAEYARKVEEWAKRAMAADLERKEFRALRTSLTAANERIAHLEKLLEGGPHK